MIKKVLGIHYKPFLFFFVLGGSITFALGRYIQFHSTGNDFWNILYYGRNMTLSQPESLYNGFYPFGYAFLIGQMPFTYILPIAYIINSLLAGLFTASTATLSLYSKNFFTVLIATFGSIAAPFVFQNTHTIGPDIGATAFVAFAVFLIWKNHFEEKNEVTNLDSILIGASLGLGFLWRTHVIVSAVAIFFAYFLLFAKHPLRPKLIMIGTFLGCVLLQVIVNLVSGHGAFETAQALNVYKFLYGVDWTYPPTPADLKDFSLIEEVLKNRSAFFDSYWPELIALSSFASTCVVCFLLSPKGRFAKFTLFSILTTVLYAIPIALGDSDRAPVMVMSAYVLGLALIPFVSLNLIRERFPKLNPQWLSIGIITIFIALTARTFYDWILYDAYYIHQNYQSRNALQVIETTLIKNGMNSPREVFSDRYNFYTPNTMPYRSRQIGNWNIDWVWGYKAEYPPLPNDSLESFINACREQGIHYLALSPNSHFRGDIFPLIYNEQIDIQSLGLKFIGQRGNMRLYEIK